MNDRVQDEIIFGQDGSGEAKYAPLPSQEIKEPANTPAPAEETALEKTDELEVQIQFTKHEDGRISGYVPASSGREEYAFELNGQNMTWGLFADIETIQQVPDEERMGSMLNFLRKYIIGGPDAVPLNHTETIFKAITLYASESMSSKN